MTKKEILEDNKLIIAFMKYPIDKLFKSIDYEQGLPMATWPQFAHELSFNTSWDCLMPVVEKIESLDNWEFDIFGKHLEISYDQKFHMDDISFHGDSKIEAVYKGVVAFIKWYNDQSK